MTSSNQRPFVKRSFILGLLTLVVIAGCSTESNKQKQIAISQSCLYKRDGNFCVDGLKLMSIPVASANSYSVTTKKLLNFQTCVTDQLGAAVQAGLQFQVSDGSRSIQLVTDVKGCLRWQEEHSYAQLCEETWFKVKREVISNSYYNGRLMLEFGLNPWADGATGIIDPAVEKVPSDVQFQEVGDVSVHGHKIRSNNACNSKINLKSASLEFVGLDYNNYEVTQNLDLKVAHKYQVRLSPVVMRKTLKRSFVPESFNTGRMKAILMIFREDSNAATQFTLQNAVASTEMEGDMSFGDLVTDISIKFNSISDLTSRTVALVTLIPLDELEGFPSASFSAPVSPGTLKSLNFKPINQDASKLYADFTAQQVKEKREAISPLQLFAKQPEYVALNGSSVIRESGGWLGPRSSMTIREMAESYFANPRAMMNQPVAKDLARFVCDKVYPPSYEMSFYLNGCRQYPRAYLQARVVTFVEKLNSNKPKPVGLPTVDTLKMSASFSLSEASTHTTGYNVKAGFTWSPDLSFIPLFKFSVGGDYSYARTMKKDASTSAGATRERTITAEGVSFEINAVTRKCLIVGPARSSNATMPKTGFAYYCSENTKGGLHVENYYLVTAKTGVDGSPLTDNAAASSSPWKMMIRGAPMKNLFAQIITQNNIQFVIQRAIQEDQLFANFKGLYMTQEYPGVLSESAE